MISPSDILMFYCIGADWSTTGNARVSADEGIPDAVSVWLWTWWRPTSSHARQVEKFWETIVQSVVLSLLILVSDTHWLAGISNQSVGQTSA